MSENSLLEDSLQEIFPTTKDDEDVKNKSSKSSEENVTIQKGKSSRELAEERRKKILAKSEQRMARAKGELVRLFVDP